VFDRFYEKTTRWLYDFDPGMLPAPAATVQANGEFALASDEISQMDCPVGI
jgi:hypothetical protein